MRITDHSTEKKYFTQIPNIVFLLGLKTTELAVYMAIKRAAGETGVCTKTLANLSMEAGVDIKTTRLVKKRLCEVFPIINKPLIEVNERWSELGDRTTDEIGIVDIWEECFKYFMGVGKKEPRGEGELVYTVIPKTEGKEEPLKQEQKQQQAAPVDGVFFECLKDVKISDQDKIKLSAKFDEASVKHAVAFANSTKIRESLIQTLWYAAKEKPELTMPKELLEVENKRLAREILKTVKVPKGVYFDVLNAHLEIGFSSVQGAIPTAIEYANKAFKEVMRSAAERYKVNLGMGFA